MKNLFIFWSLILISFLGSFSQEPTGKQLTVLAPFYAWYQIPWPMKTFTTPLRGFYNSWDHLVATEQNTEKNTYGIDVDLLSWPGISENISHWALLQGYFKASNLATRKFGILYEIWPLLGLREVYDFSDPKLAEKFLSDIDYLIATFFSWFPENVYKIDNRPVVYIWYGKFRNFHLISEEVRRKVYLIGPVRIFSPPFNDSEELEILKCWDAITSYGIDPLYLAKKYGSLTYQAAYEYLSAILKWWRLLKDYAPQTEMILPIQFAYHDNFGEVDEFGYNRVLESTPTQAEFFARVVASLAEILKIKRVLFVSYNEHYEGTGCEPSKERGYYWMELIKKYFK